MRTWKAATAAAIAVVLGMCLNPVADALPIAPEPIAPVTGIPEPCAPLHPFPKDASIDELTDGLAKNFGFKIAGSQWAKKHRSSIKILWETLDAVSCTSYLEDLKSKTSGTVGLNAARIRGYAWGDWSLTKSGYVTFDFSKFETAYEADDEGRLTRLIIHELGHVRNADRGSSPDYWKAFTKVYKKQGRFSEYAGSSVTETFADVLGYYVGRCAKDNPYNTGKFDRYYDYAKTYIFDGKEFGPAPGNKVNCSISDAPAPAPAPVAQPTAAWLEGLGGE